MVFSAGGQCKGCLRRPPKSALTTKNATVCLLWEVHPRNGRFLASSWLMMRGGSEGAWGGMGRTVRTATPQRSPFYLKRNLCEGAYEACSFLIIPNEHPVRVRVLEIPCRRHTCQAQPNAVLTSRRGRAASRCSVNREARHRCILCSWIFAFAKRVQHGPQLCN